MSDWFYGIILVSDYTLSTPIQCTYFSSLCYLFPLGETDVAKVRDRQCFECEPELLIPVPALQILVYKLHRSLFARMYAGFMIVLLSEESINSLNAISGTEEFLDPKLRTCVKTHLPLLLQSSSYNWGFGATGILEASHILSHC